MPVESKSIVNFVESVKGKFGPQVKDDKGEYYSFGKFYKGVTSFTGRKLVSIYTTDKGYHYLNSVEDAPAEGIPETVVEPKKRGRPAKVVETSTPVVSEPVKPVVSGGRDFDREAYGKIKTLFLQAVMPQLINGVMQDDELKAVIRKWSLYAMFDDR